MGVPPPLPLHPWEGVGLCLKGGGGTLHRSLARRSALPVTSVRSQRPCNRFVPARRCLPTAVLTASNRLRGYGATTCGRCGARRG